MDRSSSRLVAKNGAIGRWIETNAAEKESYRTAVETDVMQHRSTLRIQDLWGEVRAHTVVNEV